MRPPWWAALSATLAPIVLVGGWTWSAQLQPSHFDATRDTISALAARGATDRWLMTTGLALLGACHLITAAGLRPARSAGRYLLAAGGAGTLVAAAAPQPVHGNSTIHLAAAVFGFAMLSIWPVAASRSHGDGVLARPIGTAATAMLLALLLWFGIATAVSSLVGLSERCLAGAQAIWPLAAVIAVRRQWPATTANRDQGD